MAAGIFFTSGETKKRAGVYQRYTNVGTPSIAGAVDGVVAATIRSNWGETGKAKVFESYDAVLAEYGAGGAADTVNLLQEAFNGGASKIIAIRLGNGGTKGTIKVNDSTGAAIDVTAKYVGDRAFKYAIRKSLSDSTLKEFVVYENDILIEKLSFAADTKAEVANLIAAGQSSKYFDFVKDPSAAGDGTVVPEVSETAFTAGTNPTVQNQDYSAAFNLLEPYEWNAVMVDTEETAVHALLVNFNNRIYENGKLGFAVIGEPTSVEYDTRCQHAATFNDKKVVYVGGGFKDISENIIEGMVAAARIAGMVAAVPSNRSLTHSIITNAVEPLEMLTNYQYEKAIDSGMITFSPANDNGVWIEAGITTLVTPTGEDDEGWKKIKRTKVRFELMSRVNETVAPLIGQINNDSDGRATVLQAVQGVLNTMANETKILPGATVAIDEANPPVGDSAWFVIQADDIDALEKIYFVYQFRYAAV